MAGTVVSCSVGVVVSMTAGLPSVIAGGIQVYKHYSSDYGKLGISFPSTFAVLLINDFFSRPRFFLFGMRFDRNLFSENLLQHPTGQLGISSSQSAYQFHCLRRPHPNWRVSFAMFITCFVRVP